MGSISLQIPVVGQPASTEDPKIASNFGVIQTAINGNLDSTNLSPTANIALTQIAAFLTCTISKPTRVLGTAYQPNTTRPTFVLLTATLTTGQSQQASVGTSAGTVAAVGTATSGATSQQIPMSFIVPPAYWYEISGSGSILSVTEWAL